MISNRERLSQSQSRKEGARLKDRCSLFSASERSRRLDPLDAELGYKCLERSESSKKKESIESFLDIGLQQKAMGLWANR